MSIAENPFDHVLYEIEMYLLTYRIVFPNDSPFAQLSINLVLDSRAVHLRNLSKFFSKKNSQTDWRVGEFLKDVSTKPFLSEKMQKKINRYTSNATCHLSKERMSDSFKKNTADCFQEVYHIIVNLIQTFFSLLDTNVKSEYENAWREKSIQDRVSIINNFLSNQIIDVSGFTGAF